MISAITSNALTNANVNALALRTLPNLPSLIINIIFEFRSDLSDSKWVPYLAAGNDGIHETVKFKLNTNSSWFKNNIDKLLQFKIKNPPSFKTVFLTNNRDIRHVLTGTKIKDIGNSTVSVVSTVKVITYQDDKFKQKICLDFVSGGNIDNSNPTGWAAYANISKIGNRRHFIDGFYYNNTNENSNKQNDCSQELLEFSDVDSKLYNRIDICASRDKYLSSFVVTDSGWSRDIYERDLSFYE